ncbi:ABC transporter permease subunit [Asanoa sp. NPDC050611]|uniref:ABC transporter permease subunit n=1 Tax=Asanoa sp. NPDC050611 TaxID=3157098 RepID=UPI0033C6EB59
MPDVLTKTLWDARRGLAGFAVGTALVGMLYASFYPQVDGGAMGDAVEGMSPGLRDALNLDDLGSAAGYLGSSVFGIIVPLIAVIYGVATGARAVAGDEESGGLDLLLAHPVSRTKLVWSRLGALAIGAGLLAGLVLVAMLAVRSSASLDSVSVGQFAAQCVALALLSTALGAFALALGAVTGSRGTTLGGTAAVAVLAYAAHSFAGQIGVGPARYLSPFHYYIGHEPLRNGFQWGDLGVLAAAVLVLGGVASVVFNRRDLRS